MGEGVGTTGAAAPPAGQPALSWRGPTSLDIHLEARPTVSCMTDGSEAASRWTLFHVNPGVGRKRWRPWGWDRRARPSFHGGQGWGTGDIHACLVAPSCLNLWDPLGCSPPGSFVHGILQERILEWVAISSSRQPSRLRD